MATIAKIVDEVNGVAKYVALQQSMGLSDVDVGTCRQAVATSICAMVNNIEGGIVAAEACDMLTAIQSSGFASSEKQQLSIAIQAKLSAPSMSTLGSNDKQTFAKPDAHLTYFTEGDINIFQSTDHEPDATINNQTLVARLTKGGFRKPSETTIADFVCSLWSLRGADMTNNAARLYDHVQELKQCFAAQPAQALHLPPIKCWPLVSTELSRAHFSAMYGDVSPVIVKLEGWHRNRALVSCRGSNKRIRDTHGGLQLQPVVKHQPAAQPAQSLSALVNYANSIGVTPAQLLHMQMSCMGSFGGMGGGMRGGMGGGMSGGMLGGGKGGKGSAGSSGECHLRFANGNDNVSGFADFPESQSPRESSPSPPPLQDGKGALADQPRSSSPEEARKTTQADHASAALAALREFRPKQVKPHDADTKLEAAGAAAAADAAAVSNGAMPAKVAADVDAAADIESMLTQHKAIVARGALKAKGAAAHTKHIALKRPAAAEAAWGKAPAMPCNDGGSILWRGAKVLQAHTKGGWRLWLDAKVPAKEKFVRFGDDKLASWSTVINAIKDNTSDGR